MLNHITIHGRLVRDPEMNTTASGVSVCNLTVAVDRSYVKQGEERQADFFACTCWRGLADMVGKNFHKGKEILLSGEMQSRKYTDKEGNNRTAWEIQVNSVDFCGNKTEAREAVYIAEERAAIQSEPTQPSMVTNNAGFVVVNEDELPF